MFTKQPILLVGFILLFLLVAFAFSKTKKPKENLLWEITSPKTKQKSYLFGTIHLIEKEFFKFPQSLKEKIKNASTILFETPYPTNTDLKKLITLPQNQQCLDMFDVEEKNKIYTWALKYLKLTPEEFESNYTNFKPFVLAQTITQQAFLDNTISYEQEIYKIIKSSGIQIQGLETMEDQIKLLEEIPEDIQKKQILTAIDSFDVNRQLLKEMQLAYKRQDLNSIYDWIIKESSITNYSINKFLEERNEKWLPFIKNNVDNSSCFIAVGAGHLPGKKGLIQLLKNQGYKIKSIYIK